MSQKVITTLTDDLTGEELTDGSGGTVQFAFDGTAYEIDLSDANLDAFREAFSDYVAAGRKVSAGARAHRASGARTSSERSDPSELARIRQWAAQNGHDVSTRGRIAQSVRDAYSAAH